MFFLENEVSKLKLFIESGFSKLQTFKYRRDIKNKDKKYKSISDL